MPAQTLRTRSLVDSFLLQSSFAAFTAYNIQLQIHDLCKCTDLRQKVADAQRNMMGGPGLAPFAQELRNGQIKDDTSVCVARLRYCATDRIS